MSEYFSDEGEARASPSDSVTFDLREQDRFLPIANVARVMRNALPPHGKLSKEAKETVQECVSEFISFVTSQAAEKCSIEKRKTLNGEDILFSMYTLGFENYSETLKIYLAKYREFEQYEQEAKKNSNKPKRPYHRKNPKNRPKNINRFTTSNSPNDGQEYLAQNNLPTLVPTSLLVLNSENGGSSRQPQVARAQLPAQYSQSGSPVAQLLHQQQQQQQQQLQQQQAQHQQRASPASFQSSASARLQQQAQAQAKFQQQFIQQHDALRRKSSVSFPTQQTFEIEGISPSSYPTTSAGYYTYTSQGQMSESSKADSNDDFENPEDVKIFAGLGGPDGGSGRSGGNGGNGDPSSRSASSSTGNIVNYGDFMNL